MNAKDYSGEIRCDGEVIAYPLAWAIGLFGLLT